MRPICLALLLMLPSCAIQESIKEHAIAYDKTFEEVANQQILLNILRSAHRRPMHFVEMSQIVGRLEGSVNSEGSIGFKHPGGLDSMGLTSGISAKTSPSFTMKPLVSKEFITGVLSPLKRSMLDLFVNQGWNQDLLMLLAVEQINVEDGKKPAIVNDSARIDEFMDHIQGLEFKPEDAKVWVTISKNDLKVHHEAGFDVRVVKSAVNQDKDTLKYEVRTQRADQTLAVKTHKAGQKDAVGGDAVIRSPQGMIYYLGEILRIKFGLAGAKPDPDVATRIRVRKTSKIAECVACLKSTDETKRDEHKKHIEDIMKKALRLFDVSTVPPAGGSDLSVEYAGKTYYVHRDSRSMQCLSLIQYAIGLQRTEDSLRPSTLVELTTAQ